jgi:hypothetical protein
MMHRFQSECLHKLIMLAMPCPRKRRKRVAHKPRAIDLRPLFVCFHFFKDSRTDL